MKGGFINRGLKRESTVVVFIIKVGDDKDKDNQEKLEVIAALKAELQEKEILLKVCMNLTCIVLLQRVSFTD